MILLLSGPAAVGKTTVCQHLIDCYGFRLIKSSDYLKEIADQKSLAISRQNLQEVGDDLDVKTDYSWIVDEVAVPWLNRHTEHSRWIIDSVRKNRQIEHFRAKFSDNVKHIHVTAKEHIIRQRFELRREEDKFRQYERTYDEHVLHPNEVSSRNLHATADYVIDYSEIDVAEASSNISRFLGLS